MESTTEEQRHVDPRLTESRPAAARGRWGLFFGLAVAVFVADQLSKLWIDANFALAWTGAAVPGREPPTPIIGDLVRIAKGYNDGGLFGLFGASAPILAVGSIVVIALLVGFQARQGPRAPLLVSVATGLLLGGALGNLADRIRLGHVIDFVDTGIGDFRWYTFNVADSAISLAILALILTSLFPGREAARSAGPDQKPREPVASTPAPDPGR